MTNKMLTRAWAVCDGEGKIQLDGVRPMVFTIRLPISDRSIETVRPVVILDADAVERVINAVLNASKEQYTSSASSYLSVNTDKVISIIKEELTDGK